MQPELEKLLGKATEKLAADSALAEAIEADASILMDGEASGGLALEAWLIDQITGAIDDVEEGVYASATGFVEKILGRIEKQVPTFVRSSLGGEARTSIEKLIGQLKHDFDKLVSSATGDSRRQLA